MHWTPNLFKVPYGNIGKQFVSELARLYNAFVLHSALEVIALKAAIVMPLLLLQKPAINTKAKDLRTCLQRWLNTRFDGDLNDLLTEGTTLQQRIQRSSLRNDRNDHNNLSHSFSGSMLQGKTSAATRLLSDHPKGAPLHLDDHINNKSVRDILQDKHPARQLPHPDSLIINDPKYDPTNDPTSVHPVLFESIDASLIRHTALQVNGAAGPSGLDALCWRRLCTSFKSASLDLCQSLAHVAKRLCTEFVDPSIIAPLLSSRLIALNKNPGVRPIGISNTDRRIITKAILSIVRQDILDATGSLQLCAGQTSGIESAVHAARALFQQSDTEAVLLVDASNAFNSLNRSSALLNIKRLCPAFATILINTYRNPIDLFVDGNVLHSDEGTTQGDPLAMQMYALATIPLIKNLNDNFNDITQIWYADDACATGRITRLRRWWNLLSTEGAKF